MTSIAYELATSEVGMLMDCAACNSVTHATASDYKSRISAIVEDARFDADSTEHEALASLEAEGHAYIEAQVGRFDKVLAEDDDSEVLSALASIPGARKGSCGFTVPGTHSVVLSRADHVRLKRIVEASGDVKGAVHVIKSMVEVTADTVRYDLSRDSADFLRTALAGMSGDKSATVLKKALRGAL
jgi:hypothetical protein